MGDIVQNRRSERSRKPVSLINISKFSNNLHKSIQDNYAVIENDENDEENRDDQNMVDSEDDHDVDDDNDNDSLLDFQFTSTTKSKATKRKAAHISTTKKNPKATKIRKINEKSGVSIVPSNTKDMSLFDAMKALDQVNKKSVNPILVEKTLKQLAEEWIKSFRRDRISATVDIVNFILICSGASKEWVDRDVDLDALEPDELDELLKDMIKELTSSSSSSSSFTTYSTTDTGLYPISDSLKKSKTSKITMRQIYVKYWEYVSDKLLDDIYNPTETSSNHDSDAKSRQSFHRGRGSSFDTLNVLIDQLVSLSSMPVVNIRDAITEAIGSIGCRIVVSTRSIREQMDIINRQLDIEEKRSSSKQSTKQQSFIKQRDVYKKMMTEMTKLSQLIFNSIFVHRFKDSHDIVRVVCTFKLTEWMLQDPDHYFDDEYLKYICWMTYDSSPVARKEALRCLGKLTDYEGNEDGMKNIRLAVERFTERFIEIAAGDISDDVSLEMFTLLRKLQSKGYLDHIGDELDLVDQIVFDPSSTSRVRQECLAFLMDHTEGFEILDGFNDNSFTYGSKDSNQIENLDNKGKKRKKNSPTSVKQNIDMVVTVMKRHAFQLETLAEFAEYHLLKDMNSHSNLSVAFEKVDMLADACLMIPHFKLLFDWKVMTTILMKESDGIITSSLRENLVAIILRLFVRSCLNLRDFIIKSQSLHRHQHQYQYQAITKGNIPSITSSNRIPSMEESMLSQVSNSMNLTQSKSTHVKKSTSSSNVTFSANTKELNGAWESLVDHLPESLPQLLIRFRDNTENLRVLSSVLKCCPYSSTHEQSLTSLLKTIEELYLTSSFEPLIENLVQALSLWTETADSNNAFKGTVTKVFENLHGEIMMKFQSNLVILKNGGKKSVDDDEDDGGSKKNKGNKNSKNKNKMKSKRDDGNRSRNSKDDELEHVALLDAYNTCVNSLCKLKHLWKNCDCRSFVLKLESPSDIHGLVDELIEASDNIMSSFEEFKTTEEASHVDDMETMETSCAQASRDCIYIVLLILIWFNRDVYRRADIRSSSRENSSINNSKDDDYDHRIEEPDQEIELLIPIIISIRDKVADVLTTWMSQGVSEDGEIHDSLSPSQKLLQEEGFRFIGDIRSMYPVALIDCYDVDKLAYNIPQETLSKMRVVFDYEGRVILDQITNASSQQEVDELSYKLIQSTLRPLGTSLYFDPNHLNRRQASAVMMYHLMDPANEKITEFVKLFSKRLKDQDITRYMEIQLVTLKGYYQESIENLLARRLHKYLNNEENDENENDDDEEEDGTNLQQSLEKFHLLSKKLSNSLGVGKIKDNQSITALTNFLGASLDFSFSEDQNLVFLSGLVNYIKVLPTNSIRDISNHFQLLLDHRGVDDIQSWPDYLNVVYNSILSFRSHLSGVGSGPKVSGSVSKTSTASLSSSSSTTAAAAVTTATPKIATVSLKEKKKMSKITSYQSPVAVTSSSTRKNVSLSPLHSGSMMTQKLPTLLETVDETNDDDDDDDDDESDEDEMDEELKISKNKRSNKTKSTKTRSNVTKETKETKITKPSSNPLPPSKSLTVLSRPVRKAAMITAKSYNDDNDDEIDNNDINNDIKLKSQPTDENKVNSQAIKGISTQQKTFVRPVSSHPKSTSQLLKTKGIHLGLNIEDVDEDDNRDNHSFQKVSIRFDDSDVEEDKEVDMDINMNMSMDLSPIKKRVSSNNNIRSSIETKSSSKLTSNPQSKSKSKSASKDSKKSRFKMENDEEEEEENDMNDLDAILTMPTRQRLR